MGVRNTYSATPFVAPVPLEKGQSSIEVTNSTNTKGRNSTKVYDHPFEGQDKGYGLLTYYMPSPTKMVFAFADLKLETGTYHYRQDTIGSVINGPNDRFDSSVISAVRHSAGFGVTLFSKHKGKNTNGLSGILSWQHVHWLDNGLLNRTNYSRYYNMTQVLLTLQESILFRLSGQLSISYMGRVQFAYHFHARTNYAPLEQEDAGLNREGKTDVYLDILGLYAEFQPFKKVPFSISGQWYNDWSLWQHTMAKNNYGDTHIKGSGGALGVKYVFGRH